MVIISYEELDINIADCKTKNGKMVKELRTKQDDYTSYVKSVNHHLDNVTKRSELYNISMKYKNSSDLVDQTVYAALLLKVDNYSGAEKVLNRLMRHEFHYHAFNSRWSFLNFDKKIDFYIDLLKRIEQKLKTNITFKTFLFYLYNNWDGIAQKKLDSGFQINRGLEYIRSRYQSLNFGGKQFPYVWGPIIYNISSENEYSAFIKTYLIKQLNELDNSSSLFFRNFGIYEAKEKNAIISKIKMISTSSVKYEQEIFLRLLDSNDFYQFVQSNMNLQVNLLSKMKRGFYKEALAEQRYPLYEVYRLFELGDFNFDYIVKLYE